MNQWGEASKSFSKAVKAAESARGLLKSRGGLALANYSQALQESRQDGIAAALAETESVAAEATASDETDVAATARHNADVMSRLGKDLLLYEIL